MSIFKKFIILWPAEQNQIYLAHPFADQSHLLESEDWLFSRRRWRLSVRRFVRRRQLVRHISRRFVRRARVHHELGRRKRTSDHRRRRSVTRLRRHVVADQLSSTSHSLQFVAKVICDFCRSQSGFAEHGGSSSRCEGGISENSKRNILKSLNRMIYS